MFQSGREALQLAAHSQPNMVRGGLRYFMGATHYLCNELAEGSAKGLEAAHARLEEMDAQMAGIHRRNIRIHVLALVYHKHGQGPKALETLGIVLAMAEPG